MTIEVLTEHVDAVAQAVLHDWRWRPDDFEVSILGMLLYGFGLERGRALGLEAGAVDEAVLRCMTGRVGAAAKWSGGLIEAARSSAADRSHHPGEHALIEVGRTYDRVADPQALVDNAFANFASYRRSAGLPEQTILVFLNPLVMLLSARERQKGSPLTEEEVLAVRDDAACAAMPISQAEKYYASLDAQMPIPRLDPARIWEQWRRYRELVDE